MAVEGGRSPCAEWGSGDGSCGRWGYGVRAGLRDWVCAYRTTSSLWTLVSGLLDDRPRHGVRTRYGCSHAPYPVAAGQAPSTRTHRDGHGVPRTGQWSTAVTGGSGLRHRRARNARAGPAPSTHPLPWTSAGPVGTGPGKKGASQPKPHRVPMGHNRWPETGMQAPPPVLPGSASWTRPFSYGTAPPPGSEWRATEGAGPRGAVPPRDDEQRGVSAA